MTDTPNQTAVCQLSFRSPKRLYSAGRGTSGWYDYYAGYSDIFVKDALEYLHLSAGSVVMDPWNGCGTTTQLVEDAGLAAIGYDINPVMVMIAKARCLDCSVSESLQSLGADVLKKASSYRSHNFIADEPLKMWLTDSSALYFRKIERAIQHLLVNESHYSCLGTATNLSTVSSLAAFYYVALFRVLRATLTPFRSSNPTWIKEPKSDSERLEVGKEAIKVRFKDEVKSMMQIVGARSAAAINSGMQKMPDIEIASSMNLPIAERSVDAVIASPPYCTRIDYVVATKPELALLGCTKDEEMRQLRQRMIGTPTVVNQKIDRAAEWGDSCGKVLNAVEQHTSKASVSYYLKTYMQYFDSIYRSLREINRTLVDSGRCVVVVQDSYYKDVHVDLPLIFSEMGDSLGLEVLHRSDFAIKRTMAGINQKTRNYRSNTCATESAIVFKKKN
ncbi:MAG: DNA methyltransferase [Armatimonadota bacterium]